MNWIKKHQIFVYSLVGFVYSLTFTSLKIHGSNICNPLRLSFIDPYTESLYSSKVCAYASVLLPLFSSFLFFSFIFLFVKNVNIKKFFYILTISFSIFFALLQFFVRFETIGMFSLFSDGKFFLGLFFTIIYSLLSFILIISRGFQK